MDEFEKRLKHDAQAVQAEVTPQLRSRIDASLRGVEPIRPVAAARPTSTRLWWASSLTGLAAVVVLVLVGIVNKPEPDAAGEISLAERTVPAMPVDLPLLSPDLDIRSADFVSPLEEELLLLRSDLEKARKNVREDVDFTF